jgi:hypothetical protein
MKWVRRLGAGGIILGIAWFLERDLENKIAQAASWGFVKEDGPLLKVIRTA